MEKLRNYVYKTLRKSERFAKTDMVYATKSTFWLMLGQVVGTLASFVLSIIFARYLSKETFGVYRYILSMAGIATAFSLTGINSAVTRAVAQGFDGVFKKSIPVQLKWSIPQFLFALSLSLYYFYQANTVYGICFLIIALFYPISGTANTYNAYLYGKKDFRTSTYYGISSNLIYFAVMAWISIYYPQTIILIAGYYLAGTIPNVYFCYKTLKGQLGKSLPSRDEDIAYSKSLSLMNISATVAQHIDNIAIYHFLGPAQLAIYTFSTIIPDRVRSMFGIISTIAFPKLAEKEAQNAHIAIRHKVLRLVGLSSVLIIGYILTAPLIYKLFFPQYLDTVFYSQVFSLSLFAIASNIPIPALFTQKKQKELYIINVGLPLVKIILSILFIILWGVWGAIATKIAYYVVHVIISTFLAGKKKDAQVPLPSNLG